jgi:hypothetical protein
MIASLYQSGSSLSAAGLPRRRVRALVALAVAVLAWACDAA